MIVGGEAALARKIEQELLDELLHRARASLDDNSSIGGERYLKVTTQVGRGRFSLMKDGMVASSQAFIDVIAFPDKERTAVVLRYGYDLPYSEIGTALGGWTLSSGHANWSGIVAVTLIAIALFASIAAERRFSA